MTAGNTEIGARMGYSAADEDSSEDDRFRSRVHIDHGFNDVYAARIIFSQDDRKDTGFEHDSIKFENRFYLLKSQDIGFDFGVRLNYTQKDNDKKPHSVELGFYELVPLGDYELRFNQILSDDIGKESEDGVEVEIRHQLTRKIYDVHRIGLESFHDFGNLEQLSGFEEQKHTFGPVLKGDMGFGGLKYETGYRTGLSDAAPDHSFKFFISKVF